MDCEFLTPLLVSVRVAWERNNRYTLSSNTLKQYGIEIDCFLSSLAGGAQHEGPYSYGGLVDSLLLWLSGKPASARAKAISAIKHFFKFAKIEFPHIKPPKAGKRAFKAIPHQETVYILEALKQHNVKWIGMRNWAIGVLLYCCGLRVSECLEVKQECVEYAIKVGSLRIEGKGGKFRQVPLLDYAAEALSEYLIIRPESLDGYFFISNNGVRLNSRDIQRYFKAFNITPHTLRHSFATDMINNGASIATVRTLMGHSSMNTTAIYVKLSLDTVLHAMRNIEKTTVTN